ncbi:N-acetyl-D-Glu racemase DgcA [Mesorhizobium koreense]|uniref:N-acetyl-D-Glu racemase DgcA n=1 Tax=Mesorhizobium koreense TaxID=3074855 RepID=UPI00287B8158|nr:N-acetyl-D-Glu racemase DgcA [Mesorhizobium sp. WR6]
MMRSLEIRSERFPLARAFTISRGSKTEADVIVCTIREGGHAGRGECVPYARYGETMASVHSAIEKINGEVAGGMDRQSLLRAMPAGAARNAVDCALWDLEAKLSGRPAHQAAGQPSMRPLTTAVTISLGLPEEMAAEARVHTDRPLLKVKLGAEMVAERLGAVVEAAPGARLIVDANEGWSEADIEENLAAAARYGAVLIEQPLPAGKDAILREIAHPVPVCADESVHLAGDLPKLKGLYDAVNIKLDKAGGLTAALELRRQARALGFGVMVGCMVGTSLGMAPALVVAQDADFVDLDGPLLLAADRSPGLVYNGSVVLPPASALWG